MKTIFIIIIICAGLIPGIAYSETEIPSLRTEDAKVYDLGNGQRRMEIGGGISHYRDEAGKYQDIDLSTPDTLCAVDGYDVCYSRHHAVIAVDTVNGRVQVFPERKNDKKSVSFYIVPAMPITLKTAAAKYVEYINSSQSVDHVLLITDYSVNHIIRLKEATSQKTYQLGQKLSGLKRDKDKIKDIDTDKELYSLGDIKITDSAGLSRGVVKKLSADIITIDVDFAGMAFPVEIK